MKINNITLDSWNYYTQSEFDDKFPACAFRVEKSSAQSPADSTNVKITWNSELYDFSPYEKLFINVINLVIFHLICNPFEIKVRVSIPLTRRSLLFEV